MTLDREVRFATLYGIAVVKHRAMILLGAFIRRFSRNRTKEVQNNNDKLERSDRDILMPDTDYLKIP